MRTKIEAGEVMAARISNAADKYADPEGRRRVGDLQKQLGRRLREHRQGLGISQKKLDIKLGRKGGWTGQVEVGRRNLTLDTIEKLAAQLGVDPLELLAEDP